MFSRYNFNAYNLILGSTSADNGDVYVYVRVSTPTSTRKVIKLGTTSDLITSNIRYKYNTLFRHLIETNFLFISQQKYNKYQAKEIISRLNILCSRNHGIRYSPFSSTPFKRSPSHFNNWYIFNDINFKRATHSITDFFKSL